MAAVGAVVHLKQLDHGGVTVIGLLWQPYVSYHMLMRTVAGAVVRTEAELSFSFPLSHPVAPLLCLCEWS